MEVLWLNLSIKQLVCESNILSRRKQTANWFIHRELTLASGANISRTHTTDPKFQPLTTTAFHGLHIFLVYLFSSCSSCHFVLCSAVQFSTNSFAVRVRHSALALTLNEIPKVIAIIFWMEIFYVYHVTTCNFEAKPDQTKPSNKCNNRFMSLQLKIE